VTAALLVTPEFTLVAPAAVRGPRLGPKTVLVADDDHDARDLIAFRLQSVGYDVVTADNGHEALALTRRLVPPEQARLRPLRLLRRKRPRSACHVGWRPG